MQYTVYDKETNSMYLLSDYEREIIKTRIQKGELRGDTGEFFYVAKVKLNLTGKEATMKGLSERAKKHLCKVISETLLQQDVEFTTAMKKVIRINRGENGLTIEDLKTFKTPLGKNGITFIILEVEAHIDFIKKNKLSKDTQKEHKYLFNF